MDHTALRIGRVRRRHAVLMAGCALGLVLAAAPQAAFAQDANKGFQGTPAVNAGGATIFTGSPGSKFTGIDVTNPQTVITWTPDDSATSGTIDFLPNGYSANFSSSSLFDYTVLNRIMPGGTATIGINGTITSSVFNEAGGGSVWFYTPNGFVVGPSAVIQVGGLIMTTNDIVFGSTNTGGDTLHDASGNILFRGPANSSSSISIENGAFIAGNSNSFGSNSYVALVSPRIIQSGYVSADRSIAYVAAEQVDLRINAGNFDIVVGQGTTDANGIVHDGTTTGGASAGSGDQKAIQFVAVPKNTALTMLLSGSIGYTPAGLVYDDGSAIVLTAGAEGSPDGNIAIGEASFSSTVHGHATGDLTVAPPAPAVFSESTANTVFQSYTYLSGDKSVHVTAAAGTAITALNGLNLYSDNLAGGGAVTVEALGGAALAPAGLIDVSGSLGVYASHNGGTSEDGTTGSDSQGGAITVAADGGRIAADYMYVEAGGFGGFGTQLGGDGRGGTIDLRAGLGGVIETGFASLDTEGHGGASYEFGETVFAGGQGGVGYGGAITVADSSGPAADDPTGGLLAFSTLYLDASAVGGNSLQSASGLGGDAFGGTVDFTIDRQNQSIGFLYGLATAVDGDGGAQDPLGGTITMTVGGGTAVNLDNLYLDAGIQASINSPAGAFGHGGSVDVTVTDSASVTVNGNAGLSARADVAASYFDSADSSPDLTGGTITLTADNGSFQARNIYLDVSANNVGADTSAGIAQGGSGTVRAANGGSITSVRSEFSEGGDGFLSLYAEGYGTGGTAANLVTGGNITLAAESGGTISADAGSIDLYAGAEYGLASGGQATGVTAQGGTIAVDAIGGTIATSIFADASGEGGEADNAGGSGTGGTIAVRVLGGTLVNSLIARASGSGGTALVAGDGGDGTGGRITMTSDADATFTDFSLSFDVDGQGGSSAAGTGGDGRGGSAQIDILGGNHAWFSADISGHGQVGTSFGEGSLTGSGYGSVDGLNFHLGGGAALSLSDLTLDAGAAASADGDGNEAIGGSASLLVDQLASLSAFSIGIDASAMLAADQRSPDSFNSTPNARGGSATAIANGGTITTPFLVVTANATTGGALTSAGSATGGSATVGASDGGLIDIVEGSFSEVFDVSAREAFSGLVVEALGLGAEGPSAAHATGGRATLYTAGGTVSSVSDIFVEADGDAGNFAGAFAFSGTLANGFNATGGTASVEMRSGGSGGGAIEAPSLTVNARGLPNGANFDYPPVQGNGGIGTGGTATLDVAQGTLSTGTIIVNADGLGGSSAENTSGGAAFASGSGTGGSATFALSGGTVNTTDISVTAQGIGASGQGANGEATPSLAAAGTGGTARFTASGGTLNDSGSVSVQAAGFGGEGAFNPNGGPGGNGGDAFGGTALFSAPAGGTASLGVAGDILVGASAFGGGASGSSTEEEGIGGSATGGSAAMALADIPFALGLVAIHAIAAPGAGAVTGSAVGGSAAFNLIDTTGPVAAPRTIDSLDLNAGSFAGAGAASIGGSTAFTAQVGGPGSALTITNDLSAFAGADSGPAGYGFVGALSGAPVTVGGTVSVVTPRDAILTIEGAGALDSVGDLTVAVGRTFTSTGAISTSGNAQIVADGGISMTDLAVGGTTLLSAVNGSVSVSRDLRSVGGVTVLGQSADLVSLGALSFTDADATAGNLSIETEGDLLLATADATGAVTLTSNAGSIRNTGAVNGAGITYIAAGNVTSDVALASGGGLTVDAGGTFTAPGTVTAVGDVSLSADLGFALAGVVSGGTALLQATDGSLSVDSLTSSGPVTALAQAVTISSPGALNFASAEATAGDLVLTTAGTLAVTQGSAAGLLSLTSTGGAVGSPGTLVSGGDTAIAGRAGVSLVDVTSGGATSLTSANGSVRVSGDLASAGSLAALAGGGDLTINSDSDLAVAQAGATGDLRITSLGGAISSSGPISAGGTATIVGSNGVALASLTGGGTVLLTSQNGALNVGELNTTGVVTLASGRSVTIGSTGGLTFGTLRATAGAISVQTAGNLVVGTADATGAIGLTSTGGAVSATGAVAGGDLALTGNSGISLGDATSGGTAALISANGAVAATNLNSADAVSASGRSVSIGSSGALTFADLDATAGDIAVQTARDLAVGTADAIGSVALTSTGGSVSASGPVGAGANVVASGLTGVAFGTLASGGTTGLTAADGAVTVTALSSAGAVTASGRSIDLASPGSLTVTSAQATSGALSLQAAQNLSVVTATATDAASLVAGSDLTSSGTVAAAGLALSGTNVNANGPLMSSGELLLSASQLLTVRALAAGTTVSITAGDITVGETGRIGQRGLTQSIAISNASASRPLYLGGNGQQGEFSLDKDEAARLFADEQITLTAQASEGTSGTVFIGDLALAFGDAANIGQGGLLKVGAAGQVEINGAVALTTVSDDDGFSIDSSRIDVIAGNGSVVMRNAAGALQGVLEFEAQTVAVADPATLDTIAGLSDFAAISSALDTPGTPGPQGGYLQAGTINLIAGDAIYVQNGGTTTEFDDRRGFLANALNIETVSNNPQIAINGVISTPSGDLTGLQTVGAVSINGALAATQPLAAHVTINGCLAGSSCGAPQVTNDFRAPTNEDLELVVTTTSAEEGRSRPGNSLVQIKDNEPLITPPMVDEPITGVGNDDLWQVKCPAESDKSACPTQGSEE